MGTEIDDQIGPEHEGNACVHEITADNNSDG